jgi:nucleoside-diphosphate-sugar epimerase
VTGVTDRITNGPAAAAVFGSGFVGRACAARLRERFDVRVLSAPRLTSPARTAADAARWLDDHPAAVTATADALGGCALVVNAAGIADARSPATDALFGANGVLPGLIARAAVAAGARRFVHISSAAVQGYGDLDETERYADFSPYSASKALGEQLALGPAGPLQVTVLRPTSVHGADRPVTRSLAAFAASRLASVAGAGTAPTPQVLVGNVAAAVEFVAVATSAPRIVLTPSEGLTTRTVLELLGGHEPRSVPVAVARAVVSAARAGGRVVPQLAGIARRIDLLWFGQRQANGWLADEGFRPPLGLDAWAALGTDLAAERGSGQPRQSRNTRDSRHTTELEQTEAHRAER